MNPDTLLTRIKSDPHNPRLYLELAEAYLEAGEEDKAQEVVIKRRHMPTSDAALPRGWAQVCEELGMARHAQECYERALKLAPQDSETHYCLALLLAEMGHYEQSIHSLKKALKSNPHHQDARKLLAENYHELGLHGQAEALVPREKPPEPVSGPRYLPPSISEKDTDNFLRLFSGRELGYALQQVDPKTGEVSYAYQDAPLEHELVVSHLMGDIALAAYPMRSDNAVRYAALSVRVAARVLQANLKNQGYLALLEERMRHHVLILARYANQCGMPAYPEECGDRRFRLWFFFNDFTHFLKIKRIVQKFLENAPDHEGSLTVEAIPATRPVGVGWVEHPLVLPLGIQRSTLRRSLFLDSDGRAYGEQLKFLKKIRPISVKMITDQLRHLHRKASDMSPNIIEMPEGVRILFRRCEVLHELAQKARRGRIITQGEKVILFYTVGLADRQGDSLHRVLEPCPDYQYEKVQRQATRLKPNPISCYKIRELVPEITASVSCNCTFDLRGGKYPSPLLHVDPNLVPAAEELSLPDRIPVQEAVRRYINLRRNLEEVSRALARLETILERHFERKKIDHIRVNGTVLRRESESGQTRWKMERG
ncbi:MAG: tetratricopeptide repeat protein [Deltaproteobacteria bacterium]|nr:tetratricopeptide repeat protein [Deltaproteobacteria bacterium]